MDMSIRFPNLSLNFDFVPKSVYVFGFEITIYGILIAVGMILGIAFIVLEAKRCNQNQDAYLDMVILSLIASVVGARLFYVCFSWNLYKNDVMGIFDTRSGGMAFYGALLGGILAAAIFCHIRKLPFWQMADIASMGILVGQVVGRWGNFFNRESFGEYTQSLFAMQLPLSSVRASEVTSQMREALLAQNGISYIQVHPVFLYESAWCLLLLLFLLARRRSKRFQGELFMRYLAGYGLGRGFFEYLRTDKLLIPGTKISVSFIISAALFVVFGLIVLVRCIMVKKREAVKRRRRAAVYEQEKSAEEAEVVENTDNTENTENAGNTEKSENTETTEESETQEVKEPETPESTLEEPEQKQVQESVQESQPEAVEKDIKETEETEEKSDESSDLA